MGDRAVDIEYPLAFCNAIVKILLLTSRKCFRYVHLGGAVSSLDQDIKLYYYAEARRVRVRAHVIVTVFLTYNTRTLTSISGQSRVRSPGFRTAAWMPRLLADDCRQARKRLRKEWVGERYLALGLGTAVDHSG